MKVLIVDDTSLNRKVLKVKFQQHGYDTIEAHDGQEGLELAAARTPDLIVSDILMPRMDGFQFLRSIKKDVMLRCIPFVYYSVTYHGNKEKELAKALGADAFIERKMTPEDFWDELCKVLNTLKNGKSNAVQTELMQQDVEFLRQYIPIVNAKLEHKIDQLERTRDELALTRKRLEHLLAYSPSIIYSCETAPPYTVTFISENVIAMLGYTVQEFMETPGFRIDHVHPEDRDRVLDNLRKAVEKGVHSVEYRFLCRDGAYRWMLCELRTTKADEGRSSEIVGSLIDITERKQMEQLQARLVAIIEATPDFIGLADAKDTHLLFINKAGRKMIGLSEDEDVIKLKIADIHPEWTNRMFNNEIIPAAIRDGKWMGDCAFLNRNNGSEIPVTMVLLTHKAPSGEIEFISTISRDISERKQVEKEKELLEDQLRQAQKMEAVGQLAGGIAHDFNNILSAIIGYGHVTLMKMAKDDPLRMNIEQIIQASDRAAQLTNGILAFSRKQILDIRPMDLNGIIRKVEKFLKRIIGEDISITMTLSKDEINVLADSGQLEQVFMNLATNACDAMPKGGLLSIGTSVIELDNDFINNHGYGSPGKFAVISVSDSGMGMDEQTRKRIFEPFFTTKEVGKGTGLGLAMVYGTIKQHDGYINVYSEPEKGTTFRMYLPVIASKVSKEKKPPEAELPERGGETILFAEDDKQLREFTAPLLQDFGYTVIVADNGEEAVKKFMENMDRVQLLLFDLVMPKKSGKEAYDEIRATKPDVKIIFMSGYAPDIIRQKGLIDKGMSIIVKPISPSDLLKMMRSVLDG